MDYTLTEQEIADLKRLHRATSSRNLADRVKAVVLLGIGWKPEQVAEALLIDEKTVRTYFYKYKEGGVCALFTTAWKGGIPRLTKEQEEELGQYLDDHLFHASKDIIEHIKKTYGVSYSISGVNVLLRRLGFVYKKPKHVPGKADRQAQEQFIEKYRELRKNKGKNDVFLFMDGCHPIHNSDLDYGWIRKGQERELKANTGRRRLNINGAYDIDRHDWSVVFPKTVNAQSTCELFRKIEKKYAKAERIYVFCDNAMYYKCRLINEYLARSRIVLTPLPPYSPNLNLIERFWKFFRSKVLKNRYYEAFDDFLQACKNFFRCRKKFKAELCTLMTENFHLFQC